MEQKPKGPERFIDSIQKLIDACLLDCVKIQRDAPLDEPLEMITSLPGDGLWTSEGHIAPGVVMEDIPPTIVPSDN